MKVASDAIRLVSRMNRDWIVQGRRPSGICGACLLLAARMNNYRRSVREVVYVVKVADLTIQKRLEEFKLTNSSSLTVDEFRSLWLEQAHDPPSFGPKKIKKRKRVREVNEDGEVTGDMEDPAANDGSSNTDSNNPTTTVDGTVEPSTIPPASRRDADGFVIPEVPIDPALLVDPAIFDPKATASTPKALHTPEMTQPPPTTTTSEGTTDAHIESIADAAIESEITTIMSSTDSLSAATSLEADIEAAKRAEKEAVDAARLHKRRSGSVLSTTTDATETAADGSEENGPADVSGGVPIWGGSNSEIEDNDDGDLSLYDDWETDSALLTPEESLIKERIWTELNKEYIKEQEAKKLKAERDARNGVGKSSRKRRGGGKGGRGRGGGASGGRQIAASPAESAKEMLAKRAYSKKINYAALDHLFSED